MVLKFSCLTIVTIAASLSAGLTVPETTSAADAVAGDAELGKAKAVLCLGCHGPTGQGMAMPPGQASYPKLAGQIPAYFVKAMNDYRADARVDPLMGPISKGLSDADVANLAAYYATLK